jgi:hypothetical protein
MAGANKAAAAKAAKAADAEVELVVMEALESVKYGGKRHQPGDPLFAVPDDIEGLVDAGLAKVADIPEEVTQ